MKRKPDAQSATVQCKSCKGNTEYPRELCKACEDGESPLEIAERAIRLVHNACRHRGTADYRCAMEHLHGLVEALLWDEDDEVL